AGSVLDVGRKRDRRHPRAQAGAHRGDEEQAEVVVPKHAEALPQIAPIHARASTRPSAAANRSISSGVPTETRMAVGDPKPASGRTMIPSWSRRLKRSFASV